MGLRDIALSTGALVMFVAAFPACAQTTVTTENMVGHLARLESTGDVDVAALRQQALDRIKSKADAAALKRPPISVQLLGLPQSILDVQFDADSPVIRPQSYQALGRIADALYDPALLPYSFLIVGHTDATGKREYNLTLSQRRAASIRDVLVTTFKISPKRIQAVGLGEEQLQDPAHPTAAINQQVQVVTIGKAP